MAIEKRSHQRFVPEGLLADIKIIAAQSGVIQITQGVVMDMSYTGIRIHLLTPLSLEIGSLQIKITLTMPESGIPITINGMIKRISDDIELGCYFGNNHLENDLDPLMFECVKLVKIPR